MTGTALAGAYVADVLVGDPRRLHPVAGFGQLAAGLEARAYAPRRRRGIAYAGTLVAGAGLAGELLARAGDRAGIGRSPALALFTWVALGGRSLTRTAVRLADHVDEGELAEARRLLPSLCGRDPDALDGDGLSRAALESVAENTSDAVVGALLWGALAGPGGVLAYRAANTLDAMVGHRSPRYERFGWAAARLDDALGWPGARAGAGLTVLCAGAARGRTWRVLRRDGRKHPSPNAGRMEAAFAGALGLRLGGPLAYDGRVELRPSLGDGPGMRAPNHTDIRRANRLSSRVGAAALAASAAARSLR
ncbi:MAG: Adenosylcobinamide-phosphate synthase [uncultured Solirubrobacteraceae bacterium]|uniref:Cobalamin biosynthesis protein CobD n=1 Tax=uncultured Solirubrobacteraceae bacterium TaxID=1162706 RepID=A0A6J4RNG3_9ACTN|nr:MAG: Adenosylcobinamide-phosphate synthase [uncultured Solirubrobacteraceae bacterium]